MHSVVEDKVFHDIRFSLWKRLRKLFVSLELVNAHWHPYLELEQRCFSIVSDYHGLEPVAHPEGLKA